MLPFILLINFICSIFIYLFNITIFDQFYCIVMCYSFITISFNCILLYYFSSVYLLMQLYFGKKRRKINGLMTSR